MNTTRAAIRKASRQINPNGNAVGFTCKRCNGASPIGVGFTSYANGAAEASAAITVCACGHSALAN